MTEVTHDVVLLGGGLSSCLIAWRLRRMRPELDIVVLERDHRLGGEHTWSFHDTDLTDAERAWLAPLITCHWSEQSVRFPGYERSFPVGYNSITAEHFDAVMQRELEGVLVLGASVATVEGNTVELTDGRSYRAHTLLDGRGPQATDGLATGFQTFVGRELELAVPHGIGAPVIMDATVEQLDGYRFVYLLPFSPTRILVEDTYYNNHPDLDAIALGHRIDAYVAEKGWQVAECVREERGVLPIVMAGSVGALGVNQRDAGRDNLVPIGLRAGLFHAMTGYSLPLAVRLADRLVASERVTPDLVREEVRRMAADNWRSQWFFRLLTRMLFLAASPAERRGIFERFYRLSAGLIGRFYAGHLHAADKVRILVGKPPIPIAAALRVLNEGSAWRHSNTSR